ncbi:MAG: DUF3108 domain-containing protein [Candidatus Omnitrophica bacterium]|nr:DUF3108 domain-containing protein [Candidatus Omnitrophota bacterium]
MKKRERIFFLLLAVVFFAGCSRGSRMPPEEALKIAIERSGPQDGLLTPEESLRQPVPEESAPAVNPFTARKPYVLFPPSAEIEPAVPEEAPIASVPAETEKESPEEAIEPAPEETAAVAKIPAAEKPAETKKPPDLTKKPSPPVENLSFIENWNGECLVYRTTWNSIQFGKGLLACRETVNNYGNVYHIVGLSVPEERMMGMGMGLYRMDAFIDTRTLLPYYYYQYSKNKAKEDILEIRFEWHNGRYLSKYRKFNNGKLYSTKETIIKLPETAYDGISIFYVARTFNLEKNTSLTVPIAFRELWDLTIQMAGKKTDTVPGMGKREVYVLKPQAKGDEGFFTKGSMDLWITADRKRLPVYLEGKVAFGKARMSLISELKLPDGATFDAETITGILNRCN